MNEDQQLVFKSEFDKRKKNVLPMFIATVFFIHWFFYGKVGLGIIYLLVMLTVFGFIWWIIELCMTAKRVREYNDEIAVDLARDMKILT